MKHLILSFLFASVVFGQRNDSAKELADAERAFSAASEKFGIKESFLQFLADECVMFNPYPVNGKELYRKRPESKAMLTWYPTFVEVSASGDFGISAGPWEFRTAKSDTHVSYGHYFSVWEKDKKGIWKVILDNGISYPKSEKRIEAEHMKSLEGSPQHANVSTQARKELQESEQAFINSLKRNGMLAAFSGTAAENCVVYRNGIFPIRQKQQAVEYVRNHSLQTDYSPQNMQIASSGDLGVTYGFSTNEQNDSSSYIRVWRKEKEWKIAVDILEPFTKK